MKKLSILAAGVAVLSMCACTEANEFTPSTNNSTKKITEIKVSSNPSALGSRTDFIVEYDEYGNPSGAVNWVKDDELYFFKSGQNSKYQVFTCGDDASGPDANYDWNFFEAKNKSSDGLTVGDSYYAYYFPKYQYTDKKGNLHVLKDEAVDLQSISCSDFYLDNRTDDAAGMLQKFMNNYDLLQSTNPSTYEKLSPITVKEPMDYIYMSHPFALITVNLVCDGPVNKGMGDFTSFTEFPSFYQAEIQGLYYDYVEEKITNCKNCFANSYQIDGDGILKFTYDNFVVGSIPTISSVYDNQNYYCLWNSESSFSKDVLNFGDNVLREKLSFYFLVHQTSDVQMNQLTFWFDTEADHDAETKISKDKSVVLKLSDGFRFKPGDCYTFDFKVDYAGDFGSVNDDYNVDKYWLKEGKLGQIKLTSCPSDLGSKISKITYGKR